MSTDGISSKRLLARVAELYSAQSLDHNKLEYQRLTTLYDEVTRRITKDLGVKEIREWTAYGCGYASFFDSWFYCDNEKFKYHYDGIRGTSFRGVFVIFSLLEPMFAVGEGRKEWQDSGGSSYMPDVTMVDAFESEDVRKLSQKICQIIRSQGIPQASRRTLEIPIDAKIEIETNLSNGSLKLFDAFYHWED